MYRISKYIRKERGTNYIPLLQWRILVPSCTHPGDWNKGSCQQNTTSFFFLILFSYRGDDQRDNTWWISVGRVYYWQPAGSCWPSLQPFAVTLSLTDDQRAKADLLHEFLHEHHHWQSWVIREWERVRRIIWFQFLLWQCFCLCGLKWIT